jgi:hypothetical protein
VAKLTIDTDTRYTLHLDMSEDERCDFVTEINLIIDFLNSDSHKYAVPGVHMLADVYNALVEVE